MYQELSLLAERPAPFAAADAAQLWTDPHVSQSMLRYHLDEDQVLASRPGRQIDAICRNLTGLIPLNGKSVLDLGCGPGLYAQRFIAAGATVTGVDFSPASVAYVRATLPSAEIHQANYLHHDFGQAEFDLVCLVYGDVCALGPDQRHTLFEKVRAALKPGGRFMLDAFPRAQFGRLKEELVLERNLMDGFWSPNPYVGLKQTLLYPDLALSLDRYLIAERSSIRVISNWLQYLTPEGLIAELARSGFDTSEVFNDTLSGAWGGGETPFFLIVSVL